MFYVYEWFDTDTDKVFYVGKGTGNRYKVRKHNKLFNEYLASHHCASRIICTFDSEDDAFQYELEHVFKLWSRGEAQCNIYTGGTGGTQSWWTDDLRKKYSRDNVMKREDQRERMRNNNPMKDPNVAKKVGASHCRGVVIDGVEYESAGIASEAIGVHENTIRVWCKAGKSPDGMICNYSDGLPTRVHVITPNPHRATTARQVIIDGTTFESVKAAAEYLGSTTSNLISGIKRGKTYKGHVCRYANQQPSQGNAITSTLEGSTTNG